MNVKYGSIAKSDQEMDAESSADQRGNRSGNLAGKAIVLAVAVIGLFAIIARSKADVALDAKLVDVPLLSHEHKHAHKHIHETDLTADDIPEKYYDEQLIDHDQPERGFFSQRYYEVKDYFGGPGHPIFVIMAGEDNLPKILYPFIWKTLGQKFKAYSINIEHRYYGAEGQSWPVENPTNQDLMETLNTRIALQDAIRMITFKQEELGCGPKGTPEYCPVMTVGGSYPGFLAGLLRILHPEVVDIGYASSAPFHVWSHITKSSAYFDHITMSADNASSGCSIAVKKALLEAQTDILSASSKDIPHLAKKYGLCKNTLPAYIDTVEMFSEELMESIASHFAEQNMDYYPPQQDKAFYQSCRVFQDDDISASEKIAKFLKIGEEEPTSEGCFDLTNDLPPYPNATVSASDWSGVGGGPSGWFWDFQCCMLNPMADFSGKSMFPKREWTLEWQTDHCYPRFGIKPDPTAMVREYKFGNLTGTTKLLLTNGLVDGWSACSYTHPLVEWGDDIKVVNIKNGAHHSDLTPVEPNPNDTLDMTAAYWNIAKIVGEWLDQVKLEQTNTAKKSDNPKKVDFEVPLSIEYPGQCTCV